MKDLLSHSCYVIARRPQADEAISEIASPPLVARNDTDGYISSFILAIASTSAASSICPSSFNTLAASLRVPA